MIDRYLHRWPRMALAIAALVPVVLFALASCRRPATGPVAPATPSATTGLPDLAGIALFPPDNIWNRPVRDLPTHPLSDTYLRTIGLDAPLHADAGAGTWQGEPIGIFYDVVGSTQEAVEIHYTAYGDQSDPGPMPIPRRAHIGGGADGTNDRHVLVVDRDRRILYELYKAYLNPDGSWSARSGARWSLDSNGLRPRGWTSADAAGLPMLPGEIRYDEVLTGRIAHALRFTSATIQDTFIWPARHSDGLVTSAAAPPMGLRLRLKADVDISGFPTTDRVILQALKDYGMILADTADNLMLCGTNDDRWSNDDLALLRQLRGADFVAVDESGLMIDPDSAQARPPASVAMAASAPAATPTPRGGRPGYPPLKVAPPPFAGAGRTRSGTRRGRTPPARWAGAGGEGA